MEIYQHLSNQKQFATESDQSSIVALSMAERHSLFSIVADSIVWND